MLFTSTHEEFPFRSLSHAWLQLPPPLGTCLRLGLRAHERLMSLSRVRSVSHASSVAALFVVKLLSSSLPLARHGSRLRFTYFPLWAKGPASALALEHSGLEWQGGDNLSLCSLSLAEHLYDTATLTAVVLLAGAFPEDWKSQKASTPFLHLPILETPDAGMKLGMKTKEVVARNKPRVGRFKVPEKTTCLSHCFRLRFPPLHIRFQV